MGHLDHKQTIGSELRQGCKKDKIGPKVGLAIEGSGYPWGQDWSWARIDL